MKATIPEVTAGQEEASGGKASKHFLLQPVFPPRDRIALLLTIHSLPDDFIRPDQHIRRNRQTDLLGRLQIDDELELHRLLDG